MPHALVPLTGLALGSSAPYFVSNLLPESWSELPPIEAVLLCLQSLSFVSVLFFSEFLLGAAARSTSAKASFSPAAAQASGEAPFAVVQANRIHQNHIENFLILAPIVFASAAAGANARTLVAILLSWVPCRVIYRFGYCSANPFWRICGQTASITLYLICMGVFIMEKQK